VANLPTVKETIKQYGLDAKKSLGQNFIINESLTDKIVKIANIKNTDLVVEIGPGPGCLTRSILKAAPAKLLVIEKDERFLPALKILQDAYPNKLEIYNLDALALDLSQLTNGNCKIIANLPYNIAAKLMTNWLLDSAQIEQMFLMVQDEMADRVIGGTKKNFGRLAVISNLAAKTKKEFKVAPTAFHPAPKVTSAIISLTPYDKPLYKADLRQIEKITRQLFQGKRKNLRNVFKNNQWSLELCDKLRIDPTLRAEDLTLEQISALSAEI
jgi:16S rRNA (adenine1518-N6/adenine1519-N6)-dimethyltransferase